VDRPRAFRVVRRRDEVDEPLNAEADGEMFVVEESLGYVVNRLARAFARILADCLAPHGVPVGQWGVLLILWARDGQSQKELSRGVAIEEATMVRTLDRLERDGLVQRVRNPRDRRQIHVYLTDKGRELRDVLVPCAIAGNAAATSSLTATEQRQLLDLVQRMLVALGDASSRDDTKGDR
jgi:DNA-binding MarR family transcriptional regulator